jgi:hypothetical protein
MFAEMILPAREGEVSMSGDQVRDVIQETRRAPMEARSDFQDRLALWLGREVMNTFPDPIPVDEFARGGLSCSF